MKPLPSAAGFESRSRASTRASRSYSDGCEDGLPKRKKATRKPDKGTYSPFTGLSVGGTRAVPPVADAARSLNLQPRRYRYGRDHAGSNDEGRRRNRSGTARY